jgi:hypothetical protein
MKIDDHGDESAEQFANFRFSHRSFFKFQTTNKSDRRSVSSPGPTLIEGRIESNESTSVDATSQWRKAETIRTIPFITSRTAYTIANIPSLSLPFVKPLLSILKRRKLLHTQICKYERTPFLLHVDHCSLSAVNDIVGISISVLPTESFHVQVPQQVGEKASTTHDQARR